MNSDSSSGFKYMHPLPENTKLVIDGLSIGTIVATLLNQMPNVAALAAFIWTLIRIYETKTVQGIVQRRKNRKKGS